MIYDNKKLEAKIAAYNRDVEKRRNIVRQNASRRMKRSSLPLLPVPPKPSPIMVPFAFEPDGTYRDVLHFSLGMLTSSHVKLKDWGNLCYFTGHVGRWNTVSS